MVIVINLVDDGRNISSIEQLFKQNFFHNLFYLKIVKLLNIRDRKDMKNPDVLDSLAKYIRGNSSNSKIARFLFSNFMLETATKKLDLTKKQQQNKTPKNRISRIK